MRVKRLNRVELLLPANQIDGAVKTFADLLGVRIDPPELLAANQVLSTACWEAGIELIAPGGPESVLHGLLEQQGGVGAIGPIVWEVDNVDDIRRYCEQNDIAVIYEFKHENGRQISLAAEQCFGYIATFIERPAGTPGTRPGSGALINRINRLELLLPAKSLEPAIKFFGSLLDVKIDPLEYLPEHHVLTTTCWEAGFEIFGPGDEDSVLHKLLQQRAHPGAIGPIVWEVADIDRIKERAIALGHQITYEFEHDDRRQVSLAADKLYGYIATFTQRLH
jgi:hypothetical protein